jgi:hypothetical protein
MSEQDLFNCLWIAISAWVITGPLMDSDMIMEPYRLKLERLPLWFAKPLGLCGICFTGQFALWFFLIDKRGHIDPFNMIYCICISIFLLILIDKWLTNK